MSSTACVTSGPVGVLSFTTCVFWPAPVESGGVPLPLVLLGDAASLPLPLPVAELPLPLPLPLPVAFFDVTDEQASELFRLEINHDERHITMYCACYQSVDIHKIFVYFSFKIHKLISFLE